MKASSVFNQYFHHMSLLPACFCPLSSSKYVDHLTAEIFPPEFSEDLLKQTVNALKNKVWVVWKLYMTKLQLERSPSYEISWH